MAGFLSRLLDSTDPTLEAGTAVVLLIVGGMIGLAIYDIAWLHNAFHASDYGTGAGAILGGWAASAFGTGLQRKNQAAAIIQVNNSASGSGNASGSAKATLPDDQ